MRQGPRECWNPRAIGTQSGGAVLADLLRRGFVAGVGAGGHTSASATTSPSIAPNGSGVLRARGRMRETGLLPPCWPTKNGQSVGVRWARDYVEFHGPVAQPVRARGS